MLSIIEQNCTPKLEAHFSRITDLALVMSQTTDLKEGVYVVEGIRKIINQAILERATRSSEEGCDEELGHTLDVDEEYCSDFSDDDFEEEDRVEKRAVETAYRVQSWLNHCVLKEHPEMDLVSILKNFDIKMGGSLSGLAWLSDIELCFMRLSPPLGEAVSSVQMRDFLQLIDIHSKVPGALDYRQLVHDLRTKPHHWWQEKLSSNAFELKNLLTKEGNFTSRLSLSGPPQWREF